MYFIHLLNLTNFFGEMFSVCVRLLFSHKITKPPVIKCPRGGHEGS